MTSLQELVEPDAIAHRVYFLSSLTYCQQLSRQSAAKLRVQLAKRLIRQAIDYHALSSNTYGKLGPAGGWAVERDEC